MLIDNDGDVVFIYTPPSLRSSGVTKAHDRRYCSKLYKRAEAAQDGRWAAFHFSSHANPYISTVALSEIAGDMTALSYRQEIDAEDIDEVPGALWTRARIEECRVVAAPELVRIVVAVDPSGSDKSTADEVGICVCGKGVDGHYYHLADASLRCTPLVWAQVAIREYRAWDADRLVAEKNFGGLMVAQTIAAADATVPVRLIDSSRGKLVRAEPIAALAEKGVVHMVGNFPALEDELCGYTGKAGEKSPNRLDAYVFAMRELSGHGPREVHSY